MLCFSICWFFIELFSGITISCQVSGARGPDIDGGTFPLFSQYPGFYRDGDGFSLMWALNAREGFVKPLLLKFVTGGFLVFLFLTAVEQSIYASSEFSMLNRSLSYEPNNPRLQGAMAMLSVFRNDIPDAEKRFRLVNKSRTHFIQFYHIGLERAVFAPVGKWIEGLEQFVVFDPGKDKALVDRQEKLTILHIRQQLAQGKTFDARGWLAIGIYYAKINREAPHDRRAFLKSTSLNPGEVDAWFNLGSLYEVEKNWPEAAMAYKKMLDLHQGSIFQRDFAVTAFNPTLENH